MKHNAQEIPDYHEPADKSETDTATIQPAAATDTQQSSATAAEPGEDAGSTTTAQVKASVVVPSQADATVEASVPKSESLTVSSNQPVPRKRPSPEKLMQEVRTGLGIAAPSRPIPTIELSATQEEDLEAEILRTWKQHEQCEKAIAPMLYKLCAALYAPGQTGKGFEAWLKKNHKPKATAYRWIKNYAKREGLPLPYKERAKVQKPAADAKEPTTSSHVRQPSTVGKSAGNNTTTDLEFIAQPKCLAEVKEILSRYLDGLNEADRRTHTVELVSWLEGRIPTGSNHEPPQEATGD